VRAPPPANFSFKEGIPVKIAKSNRFFVCFFFGLSLLTVHAFALNTGGPLDCTHDWKETEILRAPTCIIPGQARYTCSICSQVKREILNPLGHDWQETSRKDATCTTSGTIHYTCSRCSETKTETIPQLAENHTWSETSRTPATCLTPGKTGYTCSRCGEVKQETTSALDHDWKESSRKEPTCTVPGSIRYTCSRCGFARSEVVPALGSGHVWTETERTETSIEYTCSTCGATKSEPIHAQGDMTMSSLLETLSTVFAAALGWTSTVAVTIIDHPILLFCVVLDFIGTGILLFKRLLNLRSRIHKEIRQR